MDMGKYVAVGVLAVIVLAAVTYEAPKKSLDQRDQARGQELTGSFGEPVTDTQTPVEPGVPELPPPSEQIPLPGVEETQAPTETEPKPELAQKASELKEYTVKAGQTLCDIAGDVFGDRTRWKEIYAQNRERLPDPNTVRKGMKLVYKQVDGSLAKAAGAETVAASAPKTVTKATTGRTYTVAKGDTLYGIARTQLGKGTRWKEIVALNDLPSEHLAAGTVIQLPQ